MPVNYYQNPPQGEQTSLGIVKETTPGTFPGMTGAIWHRALMAGFKPKNAPVARTGAAKRWGQTIPGTGAYDGTGDIEVETQGDTIGQLLAFAMGAQTTPSTTIVSLALSSATIIGATAFPVGTGFPINVIPGMVLTFDTLTNQETLTVNNVTASGGVYTINTTTGATKAHASAVTVVLTATGAYYSRLTMGLLPYFSAQLFRVVDALDVIGNMMESAEFTMNPKSGLGIKFATKNLWERIDASPATPAFSNKYPYLFENPNNWQMLGGALIGVPGASVSTRQFSITLNNNLAVVNSGAAGRRAYAFLQQQRNVKGSLTLGFEDNAAYALFEGAAAATEPQFPVAPTSFAWVCAGQDILDPTNVVPYMVTLELPNVFPEDDSVDIKATGEITQVFTIGGAESGAGNDDDITIHLVTGASAAY